MADFQTPEKVTVVTKDGECTLHITLDININVSGAGSSDVRPKDKELAEEEKTIWAIPEFKSGEKVKFGERK